MFTIRKTVKLVDRVFHTVHITLMNHSEIMHVDLGKSTGSKVYLRGRYYPKHFYTTKSTSHSIKSRNLFSLIL